MHRRRIAGNDEDAATDHRADADRGQAPRPERAVQFDFTSLAIDRERVLGAEQLFEHADSVWR